jgi:hypothetical protein
VETNELKRTGKEYFLRCDDMQLGKNVPTFRMNLMPPSLAPKISEARSHHSDTNKYFEKLVTTSQNSTQQNIFRTLFFDAPVV